MKLRAQVFQGYVPLSINRDHFHDLGILSFYLLMSSFLQLEYRRVQGEIFDKKSWVGCDKLFTYSTNFYMIYHSSFFHVMILAMLNRPRMLLNFGDQSNYIFLMLYMEVLYTLVIDYGIRISWLQIPSESGLQGLNLEAYVLDRISWLLNWNEKLLFTLLIDPVN